MNKALITGLMVVLSAVVLFTACEKKAAKQDAPAVSAQQVVYTCPMHPEVVSDKQGDKCPKCGMNLVLKGADTGHEGHNH